MYVRIDTYTFIQNFYFALYVNVCAFLACVVSRSGVLAMSYKRFYVLFNWITSTTHQSAHQPTNQPTNQLNNHSCIHPSTVGWATNIIGNQSNFSRQIHVATNNFISLLKCTCVYNRCKYVCMYVWYVCSGDYFKNVQNFCTWIGIITMCWMIINIFTWIFSHTYIHTYICIQVHRYVIKGNKECVKKKHHLHFVCNRA